MSTPDDKKYVSMEAVLQAINKSYISLAEDQIKRNNPIMKQIIEQKLIPQMKKQSMLFDLMYTNIYYGGSFYEGLKVGKPEEYDLDLLMSLPKIANPQLIESDTPGYVYVQLPWLEKLKKQPEGPKYNDLDKLMGGDNFILTTKFRSWVEGLIQKTLNSFEKEDKTVVVVIEVKGDPLKFYIDVVKSGPAFTLKITGVVKEEKIVMDVDIVPSLKCTKWPEANDYRPNPNTKKTDFFIVPKGPTRDTSMEKYWRLSFQEQERDIINGCNKMKPIIRLLKRLRDVQKQDSIASYYIKTIFLLSLDDEKLSKCWYSESLSCCFMKGLNLYESHLRKHSIPFYWNTRNNLLSNLKADTCIGFANKIKRICNEIDKQIEQDPFIVAKFLLSQDHIESLKSSVNLGARVEKRVLASQLLNSASNSNISTEPSTPNGSICKVAMMINPLEKLNYEMFQNSFDVVDNSSIGIASNAENQTLNKILKEVSSINARLTRIEGKVDRMSERLDEMEREESNSSLNGTLACLNFVGNALKNNPCLDD